MPDPIPLAAALGPVLADLGRSRPDLGAWLARLQRLGGCTGPIHLEGHTTTVDASTGEILREFRSADQPDGRVMVACGNRRASVCPPCSHLYKADAFQLVRAGLVGGKGIGEQVRAHPRVFATFTAPSFGPVHHRVIREGTVQRCHPRGPNHTGPSCRRRHAEDDPRLGTPLDPASYDYLGAVLWNALASTLWRRFTTNLRRDLAYAAGLTVKEFSQLARIQAAKVAEYQVRGSLHFHAVIRLDGADGPDAAPLAWATADLLTFAIRSAAARTTVATSEAPACGLSSRRIGWGAQLDIRTIGADEMTDAEITDVAVAAYIAKYATKAAETTGTIDWPLWCRACRGCGVQPETGRDCRDCQATGVRDGASLHALPVSDHAKQMILTCWWLGEIEELADLKLRRWAHMLGFPGHFLTKGRSYSTTFGALRDARAEHAAAEVREYRLAFGLEVEPEPDPETTLVLSHWRYVGAGYTPEEAQVAASIRHDQEEGRRVAREETAYQNERRAPDGA